MEAKNIKLLKPKYDVVFQALFGSNKQNITQSFISDILGKPVEILEIRTDDPIMRDTPNDKTGRLDLKTKFKDGSICQIEIQMADEGNTIKRLLYYWSQSYAKQLKSRDTYSDLNKTIGIIITNYNVRELKDLEDLDTKWQIIDTNTGEKLLTDDLELHIIMLSKAEKTLQKDKSNILAQWLTFMDNPNTERVDEIMEELEAIKTARKILYEISKDENLQRLVELHEKWERNEISEREYYKSTGFLEGRIASIKEIAKKMKNENIDIQTIIKITELTKDAIEDL